MVQHHRGDGTWRTLTLLTPSKKYNIGTNWNSVDDEGLVEFLDHHYCYLDDVLFSLSAYQAVVTIIGLDISI